MLQVRRVTSVTTQLPVSVYVTRRTLLYPPCRTTTNLWHTQRNISRSVARRNSKSSKSANEETEENEDTKAGGRSRDSKGPSPLFNFPSGFSVPISNSPAADAAFTTLIGLTMVFLGGVGYLAWYKKRVLDKIEQAFAKGYDPALELSANVKAGQGVDDEGSLVLQGQFENMRRSEQDIIDRIVSGLEPGHYFFLLGPKGTGKSTMLLESMRKIQAEGVSVCEAHPDLEVFRLRLGKALNFEYNEDTQTGLFQRRDPREAGPALDIERALNKLEKVALRSAKRTGKPLVLIFNNVHLFTNDDAGRNMLLQIQQRAEAWCESGILTVVFMSDDLWPYMTIRKTNNRMQVLSVMDLDSESARYALRKMRKGLVKTMDSDADIEAVTSIIGGRLSYLSKISRARDMIAYAKLLKSNEKAWLLSQIGLIRDCDDDVMDEQKWAACSWLLLQEFVKIRKEQEEAREDILANGGEVSECPMPSIPYWKCRQIMTRTDFLEELDRQNIITIDVHLDVTPDSMLLLQAASEVVEEEGFGQLLQDVRDRIDVIEGLHRTRELTFKDLGEGDSVRLTVDKKAKSWW